MILLGWIWMPFCDFCSAFNEMDDDKSSCIWISYLSIGSVLGKVTCKKIVYFWALLESLEGGPWLDFWPSFHQELFPSIFTLLYNYQQNHHYHHHNYHLYHHCRRWYFIPSYPQNNVFDIRTSLQARKMQKNISEIESITALWVRQWK